MDYDSKNNEQTEAVNKLLLEMVKNQKENNKNLIKVFVISIICYTLLLTSGVVGFFIYESQFEYVEEVVTETTIKQEVEGDSAEINNVEGNLYKDNATHNQ